MSQAFDSLGPDIQAALMRMDPVHVARLIDEALEERPDVRDAFRDMLEKYGKNYGPRGNLVHVVPYYNAPTACVAAITRLNSNQEWELLVGKRHNGRETLIGGYFNPYLPEECKEIFGDDAELPFAKQREIANQVRYDALKVPPPSTPEEDAQSRDTDLEAAMRKEIFQEAGIFLVPKELTDEEKAELKTKVRAISDRHIARGERTLPIVITENYEIVERVLPYSGVGTAEPDRQINSNGFVVVLNDSAEVEQLEAGDDIGSVKWIPQSNLSAEVRPEVNADENLVYIGSMRDGDPEIIDHAFDALINDVPIVVRNLDGQRVYAAKTEQLVLKIDRICSSFGIARKDILGELPDPPYGPDAAQYTLRVRDFMAAHYANVVAPFEAGRASTVDELYNAEKELLLTVAKENKVANPDNVIQAVDAKSYEDYRSASVLRMAVGLTPTESQEQAGSMAERFLSTVRTLENRRAGGMPR
jgi:8-oxo-dGTP pyrophosphatase MutT (NUDIX family)